MAVAVEAVAVFEGYGFDVGGGLRVQRQRQADGFGSGLAGVVVGRAADAAGNKCGQAFGKALAQAVDQDFTESSSRPRSLSSCLKKSKCLSWRLPCRISSPMMIREKDMGLP